MLAQDLWYLNQEEEIERDDTVNVSYLSCHFHYFSFYCIFSLDEDDQQFIKDWIDEEPAITLQEMSDKFYAMYNVRISKSTLYREIKRFHYSLKRLKVVAKASVTQNLWNDTNIYSNWFLGQFLDHKSLIFLDEVGFCVTLRTVRGRSEIGTTPQIVAPAIRSRNISVIAAISNEGVIYYEILDGPGNTVRFLPFLDHLAHMRDQQHLDPESLIVMDNVPFHRHGHVQEMLLNRDFLRRYLPPYSPFFNPIEYMFSQ